MEQTMRDGQMMQDLCKYDEGSVVETPLRAQQQQQQQPRVAPVSTAQADADEVGSVREAGTVDVADIVNYVAQSQDGCTALEVLGHFRELHFRAEDVQRALHRAFDSSDLEINQNLRLFGVRRSQ
jgi:hypothetical protein